MANVLQYGKRGRYLPRLTGGHVNTRSEYADREDADQPLPHHVMPPMLYSVEMSERGPTSSVDYKAQFTEDEMLQIVGEWLQLLSQRRRDVKRKAEEYRNRGG